MVDWLKGIDWSKALQAGIPALTLLFGAMKLFREPDAKRARIKADLDILNALPDESGSHPLMVTLIDDQILGLDKRLGGSRDVPMLVVAVLVAPACAYGTTWLVLRDAWWSYLLAAPSAIVTTLFLYGVVETAARVPRDGNGKRIL